MTEYCLKITTFEKLYIQRASSEKARKFLPGERKPKEQKVTSVFKFRLKTIQLFIQK